MSWRIAFATLALLAGGAAAPSKSLLPGADPFVLDEGGTVWVYPTGKGPTLDAWKCTPPGADESCTDAGPLLRLKDIAWIGADHAHEHFLWAPDMLHQGDKYYFYYAVGPQNPTPSRLGVAVCDSPAGPCADSGKPLFTGGDGFEAIDPMVFVDPKTGTRLLYAGGSAGAKLRVWELGPDMVSVAREIPVEQPPLFTEGVFMHERNGIYYLSWSHGHWDRSDYSVHYAMAASPLGPWKYRGVLVQGDRRYRGPGHHAFFQDPSSGDWYIAYHRWENQMGDGPYTGQRHVVIQPISYKADGEIEPVAVE